MKNNMKVKNIKKYFTLLHIIGIVLGIVVSLLFWYKSGRYSDNIFRSNIIIILSWGILSGYFVFDIINTMRKNRKKEECKSNKK